MGRNNDKLSGRCSHPVNSNTANWFLLQMKPAVTDYEYSSSLTFILVVLWEDQENWEGGGVDGGFCKERVKHHHQFASV